MEKRRILLVEDDPDDRYLADFRQFEACVKSLTQYWLALKEQPDPKPYSVSP